MSVRQSTTRHEYPREKSRLTLYHMLVINIKLGSEHASAAPPSALNAARPAKLFAAACIIKKTPQRKMLKPRYRPMGRRCMRKFVGNAQARKPK